MGQSRFTDVTAVQGSRYQPHLIERSRLHQIAPHSTPSFAAMRLLAIFLILATGLMASACASTTLPAKDIRSGLKKDQLIKLVGRNPAKSTVFTLQGQAGVTYEALEYYLAKGKKSPELKYWFLFGRQGLIGYGRGSAANARSLAFDTYFAWLATHGLLPRGEAERRLLARLERLYGKHLNPLVGAYFKERIAVMATVDKKKLAPDKAEAAIQKRFASRLGARQYAAVYGGSRGVVDRYSTLSRIGLDLRWSGSVNRPGVGKALVTCRQLRSAGAGSVRCF